MRFRFFRTQKPVAVTCLVALTALISTHAVALDPINSDPIGADPIRSDLSPAKLPARTGSGLDFGTAHTVLAQAATSAADIRTSQKLLADLGYFKGAVTGKESPALTSAIKNFRKDRKLKVNGKSGGRLIASLEKAKAEADLLQKRTLVVEKMLKQLGYTPGRQDGKQDANLTKAIKEFQKDKKSKARQKGIVNGTVIRSLRTAVEAEGKTPPKEAYTLSNRQGKTSKKASGKKKTKSTPKSKSASASKTSACPKGKEKVGAKCLKACKSGYKRDSKTNRCKKSGAVKKTKDKKATAKCKSGTEKVGNKCKKKCKAGYKRNAKGTCRKS